MIGDLAGFAAAIFHRGIPYVQIPTTLLAQVDSSIGGKTAVNTSAGKNMAGAWHHPALVVADVGHARTLPPRELKQGFAEIIKHAHHRDAEMFEMLQNFERRDLPALVRRNVEIKAAIVAADERRRKGERAMLNFGHTVGHAIERAGDTAVSCMARRSASGSWRLAKYPSAKAGLSEGGAGANSSRLFERFDLPTRLPSDFPRDKILEAIRFDKKFGVRKCASSSRRDRFRPRGRDVTMEDIEEAIAQL